MKIYVMYLSAILCVISLSVNPVWPQTERREQGNLVIENIPEFPPHSVNRLLQYQNTRSASVQDWMPGGKGLLISTRFAETTQIHRVENAGGARRQITYFKEPVMGAAVCPDPSANGFLFTRDIGGTVWYLLAKDEGHGFRKKSNRDFYSNSVALFLENFLLKK